MGFSSEKLSFIMRNRNLPTTGITRKKQKVESILRGSVTQEIKDWKNEAKSAPKRKRVTKSKHLKAPALTAVIPEPAINEAPLSPPTFIQDDTSTEPVMEVFDPFNLDDRLWLEIFDPILEYNLNHDADGQEIVPSGVTGGTIDPQIIQESSPSDVSPHYIFSPPPSSPASSTSPPETAFAPPKDSQLEEIPNALEDTSAKEWRELEKFFNMDAYEKQ